MLGSERRPSSKSNMGGENISWATFSQSTNGCDLTLRNSDEALTSETSDIGCARDILR